MGRICLENSFKHLICIKHNHLKMINSFPPPQPLCGAYGISCLYTDGQPTYSELQINACFSLHRIKHNLEKMSHLLSSSLQKQCAYIQGIHVAKKELIGQ